MTTPADDDAIRRMLSYHRRTKHHLHRYAASAGYLDWANQPDPFRTFGGAPVVDLPLLADAVTASYGDLHVPGSIPSRPLDIHSIAILFELSLGLSAWKEYKGSRWALRCNPSSGNLHPTEGYAVVPGLPGLNAGVYHYVSRDHRLERRSATAPPLPPNCMLVGLTSIHWREAWKYGERAFRYCQHDIGHAIAAVRYAAGCLGWTARLLDHFSDAEVASLLGIDRDDDFSALDRLDREHPDCLLLVGPAPLPALENVATPGPTAEWWGKANRLSPNHVRWDVIDIAAEAATKPRTPTMISPNFDSMAPVAQGGAIPAARLFRQRRSCQELDATTHITAEALFAMLDRTMPRGAAAVGGLPATVAPWDVLPWSPHLHLALFVHRVTGLAPGLYVCERTADAHDKLRAACRGDFTWTRPANCPDNLRLYQLVEGDLRDIARTASCHQDIAADGAFSLGMLADFGDSIRATGGWWYRRLFWEAGVLGQVLYLEAEAAGVRGTGIGCYFDDAFHDLLGLSDDRWQSLYHFTVGGPVEDRRLRTLAPYGHLEGSR